MFGLRDDPSRWAFVAELRRDGVVQREGRVLECGPAWEILHRLLSDGTTSPDGGEYPQNQGVLGGRQLTREDSPGRILLKRPDTVQHIAGALGAVSAASWEQDVAEKLNPWPQNGSPDEQDRSELWQLFEATRNFYRLAAELQCAVAFIVEDKA